MNEGIRCNKYTEIILIKKADWVQLGGFLGECQRGMILRH